MLRDPFAARATLEQNPQRRSTAEHLSQSRARRRDPSLHHDRTRSVDDPNLAFLRMQIDGTILHGWLLLCAFERVTLCGAHATTRDQPAASSYLRGENEVYFVAGAGVANFAPSIGTFSCTSVNCTSSSPSSQVILNLNGTLIPDTSR